MRHKTGIVEDDIRATAQREGAAMKAADSFADN
jgi:hypothetical protein